MHIGGIRRQREDEARGGKTKRRRRSGRREAATAGGRNYAWGNYFWGSAKNGKDTWLRQGNQDNQKKRKRTKQELYDMNEKQKHSTAQDVTKSTRIKMLGVQRVMQRDARKWKTSKEKNGKRTCYNTKLSQTKMQHRYEHYEAMCKNTEAKYNQTHQIQQHQITANRNQNPGNRKEKHRQNN